jgi:Ser/Thr protein kinase RdoA (MazF antagonist)
VTEENLAPAELQAIADAYALGQVTAVQHTGKVYRLRGARGVFALRFFNIGVTRAHVDATQMVRYALQRAELPVGAPLRTPAGATIVERNGLLGELQPWIAHTDGGGNWPNLIGAAGALRRLHEVMAVCDVQPEQHDDPWTPPGQLATRLRADAPALLERARQSGVPATHSAVEWHLPDALAVLEALHIGGTLDRCPRQLTHGDYQGRNLLFRGDALAGVIDFERLERRPPLYDLAWPLVFWRWFGTDEGAYTEADWQAARACCAAYEAVHTPAVDASVWATLPLLMAYIPARGIAEAAGEDDPLGEVLAFGKALDFARWLVQHPDEALTRLLG